jgi:hypothetical protein
LLNLIVAFLAPLFLSASGGDIYFARMAALETVVAYRARNHADLMAIAQVIACGLSALGSLSLAMEDKLSLSMTLRLRGNAVALNRAAEQNRRALRQTCPNINREEAARVERPFPSEPAEARYEAEIVANVAAAQKMTAEALARLQTVEPAAGQAHVAASSPVAPPPATTPAPTTAPASPAIVAPTAPASTGAAITTPVMTDQHWQAMWASAMTDVAGEFTADLQNLPPAERRIASRRAAALSNCANELIAGDVPPPPRPGDLAAIMRSSTP